MSAVDTEPRPTPIKISGWSGRAALQALEQKIHQERAALGLPDVGTFEEAHAMGLYGVAA